MAELYRLTFPNGKSYVGVAGGSARGRFMEHCSRARKGSKLAVHCAIRKYGQDQVNVKVISSGSSDFMYTMEPLAIAYLQTVSPNGYNLTIGGDVSPAIMPDVREKISRANILYWQQNPEHRARVVERTTGVVMTEEQNRKNAEAKRRHWADPSYRAKVVAAHSGKIQSEETRKKRSEALKLAYAEGRKGQTDEQKRKLTAWNELQRNRACEAREVRAK